MNQIVVHSGNVDRFFRDEAGPIGRDLEKRMRQVAQLAERNYSGAVLHIQSGNLRDHFSAGIFQDGEGMTAIIGTSALNTDDYGYPAFHDREETGGKAWLTSTLPEAGYRRIR